jgi:hypothetical protein
MDAIALEFKRLTDLSEAEQVAFAAAFARRHAEISLGVV